MNKPNLALAQANPNIALTQSLYAAFGRGDIDTIEASATDDIVMGLDGRTKDFPFLRQVQGQGRPAGFLQGPGRNARHYLVHAAGVLRRCRQGVRDRLLFVDHEAERLRGRIGLGARVDDPQWQGRGDAFPQRHRAPG